MKYKLVGVCIVLGLLLGATGVVGDKVLTPAKTGEVVVSEELPKEEFEPVDPSIVVDVSRSRSKDNTVVVSATGLGAKVSAIAYELTYESQGLIKGVNSGSKPIDVIGQASFSREVYLGTCSRNVCKPDLGIKSVSVVLEFTNASGKKSQFTKDYDL